MQPTAPNSHQWPRWSDFALGRKPVPRAQGQEGVGSVREQYNRTLSARNHSVYSRTHDAKIELALTYHFWLSYYAAPLDAAYQLIVASAP